MRVLICGSGDSAGCFSGLHDVLTPASGQKPATEKGLSMQPDSSLTHASTSRALGLQACAVVLGLVWFLSALHAVY